MAHRHSIPTKEVAKVHVGHLDAAAKSALLPKKLLYTLEYAGPNLKLVRMVVPLREIENENLVDYLEVCIDFIDRSRKEGSVLVHCFVGVSRSAAVITSGLFAYLMRSENLSQEGVKSILCLKSFGTTRLVHAKGYLLM